MEAMRAMILMKERLEVLPRTTVAMGHVVNMIQSGEDDDIYERASEKESKSEPSSSSKEVTRDDDEDDASSTKVTRDGVEHLLTLIANDDAVIHSALGSLARKQFNVILGPDAEEVEFTSKNFESWYERAEPMPQEKVESQSEDEPAPPEVELPRILSKHARISPALSKTLNRNWAERMCPIAEARFENIMLFKHGDSLPKRKDKPEKGVVGRGFVRLLKGPDIVDLDGIFRTFETDKYGCESSKAIYGLDRYCAFYPNVAYEVPPVEGQCLVLMNFKMYAKDFEFTTLEAAQVHRVVEALRGYARPFGVLLSWKCPFKALDMKATGPDDVEDVFLEALKILQENAVKCDPIAVLVTYENEWAWDENPKPGRTAVYEISERADDTASKGVIRKKRKRTPTDTTGIPFMLLAHSGHRFYYKKKQGDHEALSDDETTNPFSLEATFLHQAVIVR